MTTNNDELLMLTETEVADLLNISVATLRGIRRRTPPQVAPLPSPNKQGAEKSQPASDLRNYSLSRFAANQTDTQKQK